MNDNGPFDDPDMCDRLGWSFFTGENHRQAAQEYKRVVELVPEGRPEHLAARLLLARSALLVGVHDEGLKAIREIRSRADVLGVSETNAPDMLQLEAIGCLYKSDTNGAVRAIESALRDYPTNVYLLGTATKLYVDGGLTNAARKLIDRAWNAYPRDVYLLDTVVRVYTLIGATNAADKLIDTALGTYPGNEVWLAAATKSYLDAGSYSKALNTAEQQLKIRPDNVSARFGKAVAYLKLNDFSNAAATFTPLVEMGTNDFPDLYYPALVNRGYSFWMGNELDAAQKDYQLLREFFPQAIQFSYSLGEIAYAKKETKAAIRHYEYFLERAPTNAPESSNVLARLKELRGRR